MPKAFKKIIDNPGYTDDDIQDNIESWVIEHLPKSFAFREHQLDTITKIIDNIINKSTETTIIEAPTGSGKSLICLIAAGVLADYYKKKSYILCADLFLYKQYDDFIKKYKLNYGTVKGSRNNYTCDLSGQDLQVALCKLKRLSLQKLMYNGKDVGFGCADTCEYVQDRKRGMKTKVTLMTYSLWLHYVNLTDGEIFAERDVIFCDECHNIPNIIQMFCQPSVNNTTTPSMLERMLAYGIDENMVIPSMAYTTNIMDNFEGQAEINVAVAYGEKAYAYDYEQVFLTLFDAADTATAYKMYSRLYAMVLPCAEIAKQISDGFATKRNSNNLSNSELKLLNTAMKTLELKETLFNFMQAVLACGDNCLAYFIKNTSENDEGHKTITFACSKEDTLVNKYMMDKSIYKVMLSATVGGKQAFDTNIGIKYTKSQKSEMFRIPSTFDFSTSPIYYIPDARYKVSMNNIKELMPVMVKMISGIISNQLHCDQRGIIHTGSYKNAQRIYNAVPKELKKRMFIYESAKEKEQLLHSYKKSKNGILIGPTLTEGVDLPEDLCRFIIIMKVPFPNLGDNLVKSKYNLFPGWYESETSNTIIQAIGRGNRTPTDSCITYILDANFFTLYMKTMSQYPEELRKRLVEVKT